MKTANRLFIALVAFTSMLSFANAGLASEVANNQKEYMKIANAAAGILEETIHMPDRGIPHSLVSNAKCVASIPNVVSAGLVFGARYGKGLVSCRIDENHWSRPSYLTIAGGSWGLQIGIESTDVILVFMNPNAIELLSHDNFTLGGDASVAAGPIGRNAQMGTDYKLTSEVYSYSRSRGLFAGLTFSGSLLKSDENFNSMAYGSVPAHQLLSTRSYGEYDSPDVYARALMMYVK